MPCKSGEIGVFSGLFLWGYEVKCGRCTGEVNRWGDLVELDEPQTIGTATPNPTTFTHQCEVRCKRGCTRLQVLGFIRQESGFVCS